MSTKKNQDVLATGVVLLLVIILPLLGTLVYYKGNIPQHYYQFPPLSVSDAPKAGFNVVVFIIITVLCLLVSLLYLFPQWFGFKKVSIQPVTEKKEKVSLPLWFWLGVLLFGVALFFLWGKYDHPRCITKWLLVPLFWGIILIVDGWVYVRTAGKSILGTKPQTLIAMAICSIGGWLFFEFLNFFVHKNWFYPFGSLITPQQFLFYSSVGSSALLTIVFEWYMLLKSFKSIAVRYSQGVVVPISKTVWKVLLIVSLLVLFFIPFAPNVLFFAIWLVPMISLLSILSIRDVWTPITPMMKQGNWTPVALICLAYLIQGCLYEFWNYFGTIHYADGTYLSFNPGYWVYSIPYVEKFHIFEMPILGLFGYLPFGLYCWSAWLVFAKLLGLNPDFDDSIQYN